jgi:hypothetical protein
LLHIFLYWLIYSFCQYIWFLFVLWSWNTSSRWILCSLPRRDWSVQHMKLLIGMI